MTTHQTITLTINAINSPQDETRAVCVWYSHRLGERTQRVGQGREVAMRAVDAGTRVAAETAARPRAEDARAVATSPVVGRRRRQSNDDEHATQETTETRCSSFERVEVCRHNDLAPPSACAVLAALTDAECLLLLERGVDAGATCRLVFPRALNAAYFGATRNRGSIRSRTYIQ